MINLCLHVFPDIPMVGKYASGTGGVYPPWMYNFNCVHCNAEVYVDKGNRVIGCILSGFFAVMTWYDQ